MSEQNIKTGIFLTELLHGAMNIIDKRARQHVKNAQAAVVDVMSNYITYANSLISMALTARADVFPQFIEAAQSAQKPLEYFCATFLSDGAEDESSASVEKISSLTDVVKIYKETLAMLIKNAPRTAIVGACENVYKHLSRAGAAEPRVLKLGGGDDLHVVGHRTDALLTQHAACVELLRGANVRKELATVITPAAVSITGVIDPNSARSVSLLHIAELGHLSQAASVVEPSIKKLLPRIKSYIRQHRARYSKYVKMSASKKNAVIGGDASKKTRKTIREVLIEYVSRMYSAYDELRALDIEILCGMGIEEINIADGIRTDHALEESINELATMVSDVKEFSAHEHSRAKVYVRLRAALDEVRATLENINTDVPHDIHLRLRYNKDPIGFLQEYLDAELQMAEHLRARETCWDNVAELLSRARDCWETIITFEDAGIHACIQRVGKHMRMLLRECVLREVVRLRFQPPHGELEKIDAAGVPDPVRIYDNGITPEALRKEASKII